VTLKESVVLSQSTARQVWLILSMCCRGTQHASHCSCSWNSRLDCSLSQFDISHCSCSWNSQLCCTLSMSDIHKEAAKQVCCNTTYHHKTWPAASRENMIGGTAKRSSSLCKAVLMPPSLSRQSVDKLPLVKDEKAKLVALEIQCMVLGAETLMLPSRLVY